MNLSKQQQDVIQWVKTGRGSKVVEAVAGSGKTTLLVSAVVETQGTVAFMAFNKAAASEISARIADRANKDSPNYDERFVGLGNRVKVGTVHSFGYGALRKVYPDATLDARVKEKAVFETVTVARDLQPAVSKIVGLAKQRAIGLFGAVEDQSLWFNIIDHFDLMQDVPEGTTADQLVDLGIRALQQHTALAPSFIDFDDMIYLPIVQGMRLWQNNWVFVDEAQDTNPARRALARKMLCPDGRAVFVGDRHQAIYGFTGADADAFDQIKADFNADVMPLSVSFRCPQAVVAEARRYVSHIEAAPSATMGSVLSLDDKQWSRLISNTVTPTGTDADELNLTAANAILCRLTKPLVQTAYRLIRNGIPAFVEGRDIGIGLLKLANKFAARSIDQLRDQLEAHADAECAKLVAKGKETQAEALQDRVDTLIVMMEGCPDIDCLRTKITTMFLDSDDNRKPGVTLCTYHRCKGREWNRVYLLGHHQHVPSKWARQAWQIDQETNAAYVAITRAKSELIFIPAPV